jgi:uncharacterized protein (DUF427 family)
MGLSWQQGPLSRNPNGTFVSAPPLPERVLYLEPLRRRMSVKLGGRTIVRSDDAMILFEPARYPVAYFPIGDIDQGVLQPSEHESTHPDLGPTTSFDVVGGDGEITKRGAWRHVDPPEQADALRDKVAFAWRLMDAFYEEDERILGHAADPYHRIDIRRTSRHLVVRASDQVVADTHAPLVLYESGFAPRWYLPRADIVDALEPVGGQTFCPYKGLASYYNVGDARAAAWSYRAPFPEVERIADMVSFYPEKVTVTIDGEKLEEAPGQAVLAHGADRNLSVDEVGGIQLAEDAVPAEA